MKTFYTLTITIAILFISCSKKNYEIDKNKQNVNTFSLDAQQNNDVNNNIRSVLQPKRDGNVNFDGKNYKLNQFKSIIDTISTGYSLERISSDSIKIIRNNLKIER
jgi:hypothetical protein